MITANDLPVIEMRLSLPLSGAWVASLEIDSEDVVSGSVLLAQADTDVSYQGFVVRSGVVAGSCRATVIGGRAGGLNAAVTSKNYQGVSARSVASEALAVVSETLSTSSTAVMSTNLPFWSRAAGRASQALSALADQLVASWRVLPSGDVWMGVDSYPMLKFDVLELDRDHEAQAVTIDADDIRLTPGVTLGSDRVGRVEHAFGRDADLVTTYWVAP